MNHKVVFLIFHSTTQWRRQRFLSAGAMGELGVLTRVIAYVSHGSLLQHLPTILSYLFTCLLSEASLWSIKSAIQIDRIIIIIRLLPTDAHIAVFLCDGH